MLYFVFAEFKRTVIFSGVKKLPSHVATFIPRFNPLEKAFLWQKREKQFFLQSDNYVGLTTKRLFFGFRKNVSCCVVPTYFILYNKVD
jgi:hypothetical protein